MTNEHTSLVKYTSHTLFERLVKGLCVRGELEIEQTATYWPQVPLSLAALLSHSSDCSIGGSEGPSPLLGAGSDCLELQLELQLQLTPTMALGYIIIWHPPASCERRIYTKFNPSMVKAISWCLRPDALVSRLTAGSKVNMFHIFSCCH